MKFYHGGTNKLNFGGYGHSVGTGIWFTQNKDAAISYIDPKAENGCLILVDIDLNKCKLITFDYKGNFTSNNNDHQWDVLLINIRLFRKGKLYSKTIFVFNSYNDFSKS